MMQYNKKFTASCSLRGTPLRGNSIRAEGSTVKSEENAKSMDVSKKHFRDRSTNPGKRSVKNPKSLDVLKKQLQEEKEGKVYTELALHGKSASRSKHVGPKLAQCYKGRAGASLLKHHKWDTIEFETQCSDFPCWDIDELMSSPDFCLQGFNDGVLSFIQDIVGDRVADAFYDVLEISGNLAYAIYNRSYGQLGLVLVRLFRVLDLSYEEIKRLLRRFEQWVKKGISKVIFESTLQGEETLDFSSFLISCTALKNSAFFEAVNKCLSSALALTMVKGDISDSLLSKIHKGFALACCGMQNMSIIETLLTNLKYMFTIGHQCIVTGTLSPIYHSADSYVSWYDDSTKLIDQELYLSNPQAHGLDVFKFNADLNRCIESGNAILGRAKPRSPQHHTVRSILSQLKQIHASQTAQSEVSKMRMAPFCIEVMGSSSVAKSTFLDILYKHYAKIHGLQSDDEYRYVKNCAAKYWDGFRSYMWACVFDDVAYIKPGVGGDVDPSLGEVIKALNNVGFCPDQAALEDKGKTPFLCQLVLVSTNTMDLNASMWFSHPFAVQRRMGYAVRIVPKEQYRREGTDMIDPRKLVPPEADAYPDYWDFFVYDIVPNWDQVHEQSKDHTRHIPVEAKYQLMRISDFKTMELSCNDTSSFATMTDIGSFIRWYSKASREHLARQRKIVSSSTQLRNTQVCIGCDLPLNQCMHYEECTGDTFTCQGSDSSSIFDIISAWHFLIFGWEFPLGYFYPLIFALKLNAFLFCLLCLILALYKPARQRCIDFVNRTIMTYVYYRVGGYGRKIMEIAGTLARVENRLPPIYRILCESVVCILATKAVFDMIRKMQQGIDPQGNITSLEPGEAPVPDIEPKRDYYYREDLTVSKFDIPVLSKSWKGLDRDRICDIVFGNVYVVQWYYLDDAGLRRKTTTHAFSPCGFFYLTNLHSTPMPERITKVVLTQVGLGDTVGKRYEFKISVSSFSEPIHDCIMFRTRALPPNKDLRSLFASEAIKNGRWPCVMMSRDDDGVRVTRSSVFSQHSRNSYEAFHTRVVSLIDIPLWITTFDKRTVVGDCGSPYIAFSPEGPVLLGIHAAEMRGTAQAVCMSVTSDDLTVMINQFDDIVVQSGIPQLTVGPYTKPIIPLDPKSGLRFYERANVCVYGSVSGGRFNSKASVVKTLAYDPFYNRGFRCKFGSPKLSGWKMWRLNLEPVITHTCKFDQNTVEHIVECMVSDFTTVNLDLLQVYDVDTAINGADGVAYVNGINRSSSAGFPFNRSSRYFQVDLSGGRIDYDEHILSEVARIEACYARGERACPVFTACPKDEPRSHTKIKEHNVRVFLGGSRAFLIVARRYCLSFVRLVQNNRYVFESAPGICAQNTEWHELGLYLNTFGPNSNVAGDFAKFDKTQSALILWAAFDVMIRIHKQAGWNSERLRVLNCIASDIVFAFCMYDGDLIEFLGSNPSGQLLTVIINGLVNCIYMRYAFCALGDGTCSHFKDLVRLITYGDDNAMGVSPTIPWFNHTSIAEIFSSLGLVYTMAEKERESQPYIDFSEVTFLKRSFLMDQELGYYLAPLDESSVIQKGVMVGCRSLALSEEEWTAQKMKQACTEYFFYGRQKFNEMRSLFIEVYIELGFEHFGSAEEFFLPYEALKDRWLIASGLMEDISSPETVQNEFVPQCRDVSATCHTCGFDDCMFSEYEDPTIICRCCLRCKDPEISDCMFCEYMEEICICKLDCVTCLQPIIRQSEYTLFMLDGWLRAEHITCRVRRVGEVCNGV